MDHEHEHHRMDDDGAPPLDVPPLRIGIPPASSPVPKPDVAPEGDGSILPGGDAATPILRPSAEEAPSLTWKSYVAWRTTKCPERDLDVEAERLADLDQATHEFVGEVAELGELFIDHGPAAFYGDERKRLIDECGDILFCGMWALDAWGLNPLAGTTDEIELLEVAEGDPILAFTEALASRPLEQVLGNQAFVSMLGGVIFQAMLHAQTHAGLTANACKKRVYQGRPQDEEVQVGRIINTLVAVNQILVIANSSIEEALTRNQQKLDARYPTGWTGGGGCRTGEGK